jgi:phosphohistidine phosphatase
MALKVLFIRHASAEPADEDASDAERPLSETGFGEARRTAEAILAMDLRIKAICTSPLLRARQTAEVVAEVHGVEELTVEEALLPDGAPAEFAGQMLAQLTDGPQVIAAVGHGPSIDECLAYLVAGVQDVGTSLSKAGVGCVQLADKKKGLKTKIRWLLHREQLAAISRLPGSIDDE